MIFIIFFSQFIQNHKIFISEKKFCGEEFEFFKNSSTSAIFYHKSLLALWTSMFWWGTPLIDYRITMHCHVFVGVCHSLAWIHNQEKVTGHYSIPSWSRYSLLPEQVPEWVTSCDPARPILGSLWSTEISSKLCVVILPRYWTDSKPRIISSPFRDVFTSPYSGPCWDLGPVPAGPCNVRRSSG